ncbi:hypothetical protein H2198_009929 [Neophaeococcomyces mojaviensis]|uniref:Uncharacterized protein n=1 Tax=Neophaeococcomyces mojaviensis TaxID=3383035 RepID=A0ACC2ZT26_9EURO|nr:hypothetical protein H2198_009929 [Knufia sp. JES_112]
MDQTAIFTYLDWQEFYHYEKPFQVFSAISNDSSSTSNLRFKDGLPEIVHDVRGQEYEFNLNINGFAFSRHAFQAAWFTNASNIVNLYLPQMEQLLRQNIQDIDRVYFFDWRIRRNIEITKSIIDANDKMQHLLPARHVHIDQTPSAALGRTLLHLPEDADQLLRGRVRIVNLWRPLCEVVEDRPLAMCDVQTVSPRDLVEADHVRKHYNGSNYYLKQNSNYKWYYLSRQTRKEVTLIQMFDSAKLGVSGELLGSYAPDRKLIIT